MHKRYTFLKFFIIIFVITAIYSCNEAKKKSAYTIGFSQCVGSDLWRKTMLEEMKTELSLHPGVDFIYTDAENNSNTQISQVRKMLNDGIDLLIISPNEAQPLTPVVEEAYNKGIPVIVIDRKTASSLYTAFVGADNYEIGKMAGQYVGSISKERVNVLEITGLPRSSAAIERDHGFMDGIKKFPNVQIKAKIYGDWLKEVAESELLNFKAKLPEINMIFAHNDRMASGAKEVLGKIHYPGKIKVIGVDALPGNGGGLQMIDSKTIDASLLYPTGGKEAIVTAFHILNKEPFSRENILQSLVIDSTNVQLMKMQWSKISSQQDDIVKQRSILEEQLSIYRSQQIVLNIIVISLVLAIVFGGLAFYSLLENRKINKSLEVKNGEILSQRNQLIEMSAKAEAATEARLNFFTNVSHEFRTPLTLMLSPLQDLLGNDKIVSLAGRNVKMIQQNAYRLLKLVNQLIDYRKIEFDKQRIKTSENNLVAFVKEVMECFRVYAQKQNIQLTLISKEKNIPVWFEAEMLDKVFFNLLSNAIKFCSEDGLITITIHREDTNYVHIEVADNGVGMSAEDTSLVFNQFYQADNSPITGSGIGLSLSKEIVLMHHGHIEVKSQKWKGTTFTVSLPLGDHHLGLIEKDFQRNEWSDMAERSKIYQADLEKITGENEQDIFTQPKEHSILIVEDNKDLLAYLVEKFSASFEVYAADNGKAALTKAYERVPDLILSDVVLPGLSGKTIVEKLKSDVSTSHIPIILLTSQGSLEHQISGVNTMADLYITKPFNFDHLLASVQNLIKNRIILKEHFTSDISTSEKLPISKGIDKKFINDFAGIVEQNLSNDKFNVDDICKIIGISRIQLYRKVKALLGCSITDYILNRRLKKAKYLLNNESLTISEITYKVGFSNPNYFSTVFKSKYGCTPSEFKRNQHS
ncbi:substrate-binding domain-containing protein [uncultured Mucilaginibacter sp.]|uniref:substrate-binding domain-containing protein n=1 Tax=uncultured Mucilaginibacter sp. TaxID=797541 RepID=UPI0025EEC853|nr:substrate-binding domain-containing protein [uncultured Mucilaginibacter sp.]